MEEIEKEMNIIDQTKVGGRYEEEPIVET